MLLENYVWGCCWNLQPIKFEVGELENKELFIMKNTIHTLKNGV